MKHVLTCAEYGHMYWPGGYRSACTDPVDTGRMYWLGGYRSACACTDLCGTRQWVVLHISTITDWEHRGRRCVQHLSINSRTYMIEHVLNRKARQFRTQQHINTSVATNWLACRCLSVSIWPRSFFLTLRSRVNGRGASPVLHTTKPHGIDVLSNNVTRSEWTSAAKII